MTNLLLILFFFGSFAFSIEAITEYHPNDMPKIIKTYSNYGKLELIKEISYYSNGIKESEMTYSKGKIKNILIWNIDGMLISNKIEANLLSTDICDDTILSEDLTEIMIIDNQTILFNSRYRILSDIIPLVTMELQKNRNMIFAVIKSENTSVGDWISLLYELEKVKATYCSKDLTVERVTLPDPPSKPSIPVVSDDNFLDEDYNFFDTDFDDWGEWEAPPEEDEGDVEFVAYDKAPIPKSGKSIFDFLVYPKIAIEMKLEGKVFMRFFIDKKGKVKPNSIRMTKGNPVFEEAAATAVAKSEWKPAMQRDMKVGVYVTIPVPFKLKDANN